MARASVWLAALLLGVHAPSVSSAPAPLDYTDAAFAAAQARGSVVIVESYASWCLPCRIQDPILARLRSSPPYRDMLVLRIGEKTPEKVWQRFRVSGYGTLVVFRGKREVARGTPTSEATVRDLLSRAL